MMYCEVYLHCLGEIHLENLIEVCVPMKLFEMVL